MFILAQALVRKQKPAIFFSDGVSECNSRMLVDMINFARAGEGLCYGVITDGPNEDDGERIEHVRRELQKIATALQTPLEEITIEVNAIDRYNAKVTLTIK